MGLIELYKDQMNQDTLKTEIKEVIRCYRHSWDIYSELLQNSVDAINRKYRELVNKDSADAATYTGEIKIHWNKDKKELTIIDNGIGMHSEKLNSYLLPKSSGKKIGNDYGFKGYGFTYAAFISNNICIKSKHIESGNWKEIQYENLFGWLVGNSAFPSGPTPNPIDSTTSLSYESGTEISIALSDDYTNKFPAIAALDDMVNYINTAEEIEKLEYILRTRTAIGNTKKLFNKKPIVSINIDLSVTIDNVEYDRKIDYSYKHPKDDIIEMKMKSFSFEQYINSLKTSNFKKDFNALFHLIAGEQVGDRKKINFDIALCAIGQTRLTNIAKRLSIPTESDYYLASGIYLSINGMPTGIRIDNWENKGTVLKRYYIIVDADLGLCEQLDSGRKGISKYYADLISECVRNSLQVKINKDDPSFASCAVNHLNTGRITNFIDTGKRTYVQTIKKFESYVDNYTSEEKNLVDKIKEISPLTRIPATEQEVIILFYSLLNAQKIRGYKTVYLSSNTTYDGAFKYKLDLENQNLASYYPLGISPTIASEIKDTGEEVLDIELYATYHSFLCNKVPCVEFKQSINDFIKEISHQSEKNPSTIDLLITWDYNLNTLDTGLANLEEEYPHQRLFFGCTHILKVFDASNSTDINCIVLKDVLSILIKNSLL